MSSAANSFRSGHPPTKMLENLSLHPSVVAMNWPLNRQYFSVPGIEDMTPKDLTEYFRDCPVLPADTRFPYIIAGFALVDIFETPTPLVKMSTEHTERITIPLPDTNEITTVNPVLVQFPLKHTPGARVGCDWDDDDCTFGEMGYDRDRHAIQIYPERIKHQRELDSECKSEGRN
jgi:hypothetical protein